MTLPCRIVGPYLPLGEDEWRCLTHGIAAVLIDPSKVGTHPIRREDLWCPSAKNLGTPTKENDSD